MLKSDYILPIGGTASHAALLPEKTATPPDKRPHSLQSLISLDTDMSGDIINIFFIKINSRGGVRPKKVVCCLRATPCHRGLMVYHQNMTLQCNVKTNAFL